MADNRVVKTSPVLLARQLTSLFPGFEVASEEDTEVRITGISGFTKLRVLHEYLLSNLYVPMSPTFNRGFSDYIYYDALSTVKLVLSIVDDFSVSITITSLDTSS